MAGKDTDRLPTVSIDVHRPWRGELLEREPPCGSLHRARTHTPTWSSPFGKDLRRRKWVVARPVQRLWRAGRQGAGGGLGTGNEIRSMTLKRGDWLAKDTVHTK